MKYRVLIADPPWSYEQREVRGAAENHYETMPIDALCALPVETVMHADSIALVWATWPLLPEGLRVLNAWGFAYLSAFPWVKIHGIPQITLWDEVVIRPRYGVGYWARGCSEVVLIGRRGNVKHPVGEFMGLLSENYRHSRKPDNIHHYAESMDGPYLEMFARRRRDGWTCIGNELDGLDIRESLARLASDTPIPAVNVSLLDMVQP